MSSPIPPANDPQTAIRDITARIEAALVEIRRDIHAHPELAFEEVRTAGVVARELSRIGIAHQTGVAKTGVVGGGGAARTGAAAGRDREADVPAGGGGDRRHEGVAGGGHPGAAAGCRRW